MWLTKKYFHTIGRSSKGNISNRQSFVINVGTNMEKHKLGDPFLASDSFSSSPGNWNINVLSAAITWGKLGTGRLDRKNFLMV